MGCLICTARKDERCYHLEVAVNFVNHLMPPTFTPSLLVSSLCTLWFAGWWLETGSMVWCLCVNGTGDFLEGVRYRSSIIYWLLKEHAIPTCMQIWGHSAGGASPSLQVFQCDWLNTVLQQAEGWLEAGCLQPLWWLHGWLCSTKTSCRYWCRHGNSSCTLQSFWYRTFY